MTKGTFHQKDITIINLHTHKIPKYVIHGIKTGKIKGKQANSNHGDFNILSLVTARTIVKNQNNLDDLSNTITNLL